eukprot:scaffold226_cov167-Pinguiococcus_pyrenoidosus.AAC.12
MLRQANNASSDSHFRASSDDSGCSAWTTFNYSAFTPGEAQLLPPFPPYMVCHSPKCRVTTPSGTGIRDSLRWHPSISTQAPIVSTLAGKLPVYQGARVSPARCRVVAMLSQNTQFAVARSTPRARPPTKNVGANEKVNKPS